MLEKNYSTQRRILNEEKNIIVFRKLCVLMLNEGFQGETHEAQLSERKEKEFHIYQQQLYSEISLNLM